MLLSLRLLSLTLLICLITPSFDVKAVDYVEHNINTKCYFGHVDIVHSPLFPTTLSGHLLKGHLNLSEDFLRDAAPHFHKILINITSRSDCAFNLNDLSSLSISSPRGTFVRQHKALGHT